MAHHFLSPGWVKEATKLLSDSKEFRVALGGQSGTLLAEVTEAPGGQTIFLFFEFHDGKLKRADAGSDGHVAGTTPQLHVVGTYDAFARLQRGELSLQAAYFQRRVRVLGDFQRAMRFAPAFLAYNSVVRRVETDY